MSATKLGKMVGFTLVELLIVIFVIAILAGLVIASFNGIQERAKIARAQSDIATIAKALTAAKTNTGKTLNELAGDIPDESACKNADIRNAGPNHACRLRMNAFLVVAVTYGNASQGAIDELKKGDPWNSPYVIDANEGETSTAKGCGQPDMVLSVGSSGLFSGGTTISRELSAGAVQAICS